MLEQIFSMIFTTSFGYSIIRITSPILFAALAAVVAEKAGVTNIGLEGIMMISALFGVLFAYWTSYWWVGVIGAVVVGIILALIIGIFALKLKTDIRFYLYLFSAIFFCYLVIYCFNKIALLDLFPQVFVNASRKTNAVFIGIGKIVLCKPKLAYGAEHAAAHNSS